MAILKVRKRSGRRMGFTSSSPWFGTTRERTSHPRAAGRCSSRRRVGLLPAPRRHLRRGVGSHLPPRRIRIAKRVTSLFSMDRSFQGIAAHQSWTRTYLVVSPRPSPGRRRVRTPGCSAVPSLRSTERLGSTPSVEDAPNEHRCPLQPDERHDREVRREHPSPQGIGAWPPDGLSFTSSLDLRALSGE